MVARDKEQRQVALSGGEGRSDRLALARPVLVLGVFLAAAALYSAHFSKVLDRLSGQKAVSDAAGMLTKDELALAADFAAVLRKQVGLEFMLATFEGDVAIPETGPKTIFFGLSRDGRAVVVLPPLAAKALGEKTAAYLSRDHFPDYLARNQAGEGLRRALKYLWDGLAVPGDADAKPAQDQP